MAERVRWGLTGGVHDRQHDGGDPRDLAVAGVEDDLDVLEEDGDGLGECVREADGDEGSDDHGPPPAAVRRGHGGGTRGLGWHHGPSSRRELCCKRNTRRRSKEKKVRAVNMWGSCHFPALFAK